ncbi:SAM-dependent methyltransferase [Spirilliplanes yamanashiensis]|uniref:Methyltransferase domain-containing protein n=1 Tax=Spirilliplanes yamanashiensis TaxID=42233 RepID=A0A8J3Y3I1_9ACTN|nr:class I SAM-dependent methyltransferase [Spirilliplanes yamanashiensis]MDP9814085.1 hypothetical protein [Spirilliplanes yamanashiensis]GIJ00935.1 hypothetical protein Sya03_02870 [Spirilliplanes yamanashiensis]
MSRSLLELAAEGHRLLHPLSDAKLLDLGAIVGVGRDSCVLELACGKGEVLCRWAQAYGARGVGVEHSELFVAAARSRAAELGVADRVRIGHGEPAGYHPEPGGYHVAACLATTAVAGGVTGAIELLRPAVRSTGVLLIGEPFWTGDRPEDSPYQSLDGLLDAFDLAGADLVEMVAADADSWDRYVAGQWWTLRTWLDAHAGDKRAPDARVLLDESRRRYLAHERGRLGWAVFVLRPER